MPSYNDLRPDSDHNKREYALIFPDMTMTERKRAIRGILRLKEALDNDISARHTDGNLLIASWNIKEFGHTQQRLPEAYFYIAEVVSRFDLVIVQEIKTGLDDLQILLRILGDDWDYIVNDITSGTDGNSERSAYLYNAKRVKLSGTVGELVLWDDITRDSEIKQLKRTPYLTGFRAGWKEFALLNLHLQPNKSEAAVAYRKEEVRLLLAALEKKMGETWTKNLIIAGDFNFYRNHDDETISMIEDAGFFEVDRLVGLNTNAADKEAFDRMFIRKNDYFKIVRDDQGSRVGGVFDPFDSVYRDGDVDSYRGRLKEDYGGTMPPEEFAVNEKKQNSYYRHPWRRNQLSDHLPIWFELKIDSSVRFLEDKLEQL